MKPRRRVRQSRRLTAVASLLLFACAPAVVAQSERPPATASAAFEGQDDLSAGLRLLEGVRDYVFSFDDPAFYFFCRRVRRHPDEARQIGEAAAPTSWKFLLERPADYRGRLVAVEGILQAKYAYEVANRSDLGTLRQYELSQPGTGAICTIVAAEESDDLPLGARVRGVGYFIKVRSFRTTAGATGAGPLIVAPRLDLIQPPPGPLDVRRPGWLSWTVFFGSDGSRRLVVAVALLAVIWLVIRRRLRRTGPPAGGRSFGRRCGKTPESDDDFDWLSGKE